MPTFFVNEDRVDIAATVPEDTPLPWIGARLADPRRHRVRLRHRAAGRLHRARRGAAGARKLPLALA
jgi:hypothetical protein